MDQVFFDGLGNVTVIGNTVRLDFVTFSPTEKDASGRPQAVFGQRVVMTIESFVSTAAKLQETAQALAKFVQGPRDTVSPEGDRPVSPREEPGAAPRKAEPPDVAQKPRLFP